MSLLRLPDRRLRIAFFGTPDIARTVLEALLRAGEDDVVLVVSQPDRPKGRGKKLVATPVKALAEMQGLPVRQPRKLKDGVLAAELRALDVDLAIVVAYGRLMPTDLFEAPRFDTWNVHASLLPRHRGASPIQHAILAGDDQTGVSLMLLCEEMDAGAVLSRRELPLEGGETGGSLTLDLADLGAAALLDGIRAAKTKGLTVTPQDVAQVTYAPLIDKKMGALDFTRPAHELERCIRAFQPWPTCFVAQGSGPLKVLEARVVPGDPSVAPGVVVSTRPELVVQTSSDALALLTVQPPGKRPMEVSAFLNGAGRHISIGSPLREC